MFRTGSCGGIHPIHLGRGRFQKQLQEGFGTEFCFQHTLAVGDITSAYFFKVKDHLTT